MLLIRVATPCIAESRYALTDTSIMSEDSLLSLSDLKRRPKYSGSVETSLRRMYLPKKPAPYIYPVAWRMPTVTMPIKKPEYTSPVSPRNAPVERNDAISEPTINIVGALRPET